jgi:translation elongation factor EF-Ts
MSRHVIHSHVHHGRVGVLLEVAVGTDAAVRLVEVARLLNDLAIHIAALAPESVPALLAQPFVNAPELTVGQLVAKVAAQIREEVRVTRFVRWDTGVR